MSVKRWNGTSWVIQSGNANPVKYQATPPANAVAGDIWIESDVDVPSIDSSQFLRWRKTMAGGETSLSGNDDSSLSLVYTPGYEQLYINGVLQVRSQDYTATTGTTVTGLVALVAGDTVEIFSAVARTVADVYTQTQSDARFVNRSVGGLNLVVPTSVTVGSGSFALSANGQITFTGADTVTLNNCFSSTYDTYRILISAYVAAGSPALILYFRDNTPLVVSGYYGGAYSSRFDGVNGATAINNAGFITAVPNVGSTAAGRSVASLDLYRTSTDGIVTGSAFNGNTSATVNISANRSGMTNFNGISVSVPTSTMTGTIRVYGYNNGA